MAVRLAGRTASRLRDATWWMVAAAALGIVPAACSQGRGTAPASAPVERQQLVKAEPALAAQRAVPAAPEQAPGGSGAGAQAGAADRPGAPGGLESMAAARKLVRTGRLSIEVASYTAAAEKAVRLAEGLRGYLADSQSARSEHGKLRGSLTLRVPAEHFGALVEGLKALGAVQSESVSAQDVTKAYADLETRLRVKRETAERLRQILTTRAAKLSDVLEAERELARVTEEIETLEGERRYYDQQVALSTITAELAEPEPLVRAGFLDPIRNALGQSLELLGGSIAALLALVVVALPWVVALAGLWWLVRRLRARRRAGKA